MSEAFVYIWRNAKTKRFYLGSHKGTIDDGYTHSSDYLPDFPRYSRVIPDHYTRRILAYGTESEMWALERELQLNRKAKCWDRYYNINVANYDKKLPPIKWLHECFALRGVWDENFRAISSDDRKIEYSMLDTMINLHRRY